MLELLGIFSSGVSWFFRPDYIVEWDTFKATREGLLYFSVIAFIFIRFLSPRITRLVSAFRGKVSYMIQEKRNGCKK